MTKELALSNARIALAHAAVKLDEISIMYSNGLATKEEALKAYREFAHAEVTVMCCQIDLDLA